MEPGAPDFPHSDVCVCVLIHGIWDDFATWKMLLRDAPMICLKFFELSNMFQIEKCKQFSTSCWIFDPTSIFFVTSQSSAQLTNPGSLTRKQPGVAALFELTEGSPRLPSRKFNKKTALLEIKTALLEIKLHCWKQNTALLEIKTHCWK